RLHVAEEPRRYWQRAERHERRLVLDLLRQLDVEPPAGDLELVARAAEAAEVQLLVPRYRCRQQLVLLRLPCARDVEAALRELGRAAMVAEHHPVLPDPVQRQPKLGALLALAGELGGTFVGGELA